MATLETFFVKLAQPSRIVVTDTHTNDSGKCKLTNSETASISKHTTKSSPEKQRNKRSHEGGNSSDRLKTRKKHKVVIDVEARNENDLPMHIEKDISDGELSDKGAENVPCKSEVIKSTSEEISYEDFLAANRTTCVDIDGERNNSSEVIVNRKVSVPADANEQSDSIVEKACKSEKVVDLELHSEEACKVEEVVELPVNTVVSKDIRSFFGKATAATKQTNDKKLCATLVKVKAEIHQDQNMQTAVVSNKHSTNNNRHVDLARWQRANIVITSADLDIETIDIGDIDVVTKEASSDSKDASITVLDKSPVDIKCDVHSLTTFASASKNIVSGNAPFPVDKQPPSSSVKIIEDTRISLKTTRRESHKNLTDGNKLHSKQSLLNVGAKRETCVVDEEFCNRAINQDSIIGSVVATDDFIVKVKESTDEKCCTKSNMTLQSFSHHEEQLNHQDSKSSSEIQSSESNDVSKKASVTKLNSSEDKLADIFTPRSRRYASAEHLINISDDDKQTEEDDAKPMRRHSSRLSAKAALDAISRSVEILQNTPKLRNKKSPVDDDTDSESDVEVVDSEIQVKNAKHKGSNTVSSAGKGAKLAPIFEKRSTAKVKKSPVLSAAEIEAQRIRREFLISGVPEELKRQQEANQALAFCPVPAAWPKDSHIQQRPSGIQKEVDPWNLPEAQLPLKSCCYLDVAPKASGHGSVLLGGLPVLADEPARTQLLTHEAISKEAKSSLLDEIRTHNRQFPVSRFYAQLMTKQNQIEPTIKTSIDDPPSNRKSRSCSAVVQPVGVRGEKALDQEESSDGDSMLWTDKYAPRCATEIVGNWSASKKLRDWLTLWKERITRFAEKSTHKGSYCRKKVSTVNNNVNNVNNDSDFDYSIESYDSDNLNSGDSYLCNAMVLYGPHGIGKTAMVYAMANELGFKIFEVNSSGQRDGKHVLAQLQEATQSHQVSRTQTSAANFPDNERLSSSATLTAAEPENVKRSKKTKSPVEERSNADKNKSNGEERPFASLFARANLTSSNTKKQGQTIEECKKKECKNKISEIEPVSMSKKGDVKLDLHITKKDKLKKSNTKPEQDQIATKQINEADKIASTTDHIQKSLILFEEVDVVLDEDRGFWHAIETFMNITKRPIVLTASDSQFISRFTGRVESIKLHMPQLINTASYLQTICIVENVRTSYADLLSLASLTCGDVRQAMLQLQCWVQTGGSACHRTLAPVYVCTEDEKTEASVQEVPEPKIAVVASVEDKTQVYKKQIDAEVDSDEDFAQIRRSGKRRRVQRVASSDDDSQSSTVRADESSIVNVDDCSQESCSQTACEFDASVPFTPTIALDREEAPPVYHINVNFIGGYSARHKLLCGGEAIYRPQWIGDCWWPTLSTFDSAVQDVSLLESALSDCGRSSSKSMYALYDHFSFVDSCFSQRYCTKLADNDYLLPGNTDSLPCDDVRNLSLVHRKDVDEMRSVLDELVHIATDRWHLNKNTTNNDEQTRRMRQEVSKYEKLALDVRVTDDYVMSRNLGLQRRTLSLDYLPSLRAMAKSESVRQVTNSKRRFYHHLRSPFPDLKPSVLNHLCTAFS